MSPDSHQCVFLAFDRDMNYMVAEPISHVTDTTLVAAFDEVFAELTKKGSTSRYTGTDNQAAGPLAATEKDTRWRVASVLEGPHCAGMDVGEGEGHTGLVATLYTDMEKGAASLHPCTTSSLVRSLLPLLDLTSMLPGRQSTKAPRKGSAPLGVRTSCS